MSDIPTEEKLAQFIQLVLTKLVRIIQVTIPLITRFSSENPTAFIILTLIVLAFIVLRIIRNIYTIVRRLVFLSLIIFLLLLYVRGFDTVIMFDLPFLYKLILNGQDLETVMVKWGSYLSRTSIHSSHFLYNFCKVRLQELWQSQQQQ
ncbi:hypothetical protein ZYGR_0N07030 [Zygosaccharomyces rouxii]|uniref:ZYRO0D16412p n=2 Tax=Zygosaccharomyces rouxii TaxID=4956 RepID=C5DWP2_ZYGRC|nr:uncharacterized protein ZYRO0D16412g [Zygosaccharomyces rouxii]KAH9201121.1 hypothetical protein LQ764DRAFT_224581 [Zygosaccharomyces rouxii]GAV49296.1 hypothetical protein ZYGR_0N07030 [Zygosaccharomyces rouxii]CAR28211.1 ZYRO0D16412p [Zygosaccharomyces rouxii]